MSLQWTFVATFLYAEITLVILFLLPIISPTRWQKIFRSRLLNTLAGHANIYFNILIVILLVLFADSIRDVRKYSNPMEDETDLRNNPQAEVVLHMKLFRAQRNFYIGGFALFLWLVLRRMVTLISVQATVTADLEATKRQAESATAAAQRLIDEQGKKGTSVDPSELDKANLETNKAKEELSRAKKDLDAMKKQAESTNTEYDRLLKEHAALQAQLAGMEGGDVKKDN